MKLKSNHEVERRVDKVVCGGLQAVEATSNLILKKSHQMFVCHYRRVL